MTEAKVGANSGDVAMHQSLEVDLVAPKDALLLHRPPRGGLLPKTQFFLQPLSVDQFAHHESRLLRTCIASTVSPPSQTAQRQSGVSGKLGRNIGADWRVVRWMSSVGRRSSCSWEHGKFARIAEPLESTASTPGPHGIRFVGPRARHALFLEQDLFLKNLKCARRGAAGGRSRLTSGLLRPILMCHADSEKFWKVRQKLARARVPDEIVNAIRMGRLTALNKES